MSAHRLAALLLEGPDDLDPKDYIDRTLPDPEPPYYVVKRDENSWFNRGVMAGGSEPVVVAVFREKQKAINYAHNLGGKVYRCTGKSKSVRAWFKVGNKLNEAGPDDPDDLTDRYVEEIRAKPVPARIVSDDGSHTVNFDARPGLDALPDKWVEWLRKEDFRSCEAADRLADYGGPEVNAIQDAGPYEVFVLDVNAAEEYLQVRRSTSEPPPEAEGRMPE
jgi:hypothetical protein